MKIIRYAASFAISIGLMAAPPAFAAPKELHLKPTTKWGVNYSDDSCRLARIFGEGDEQVLLYIDRYSPAEAFRLTLGGKLVKVTRNGNKVKLRFGPTEEEQEVVFAGGDLDKKTPALIIESAISMAPPSLADLEAKLRAQKNKDFSPDAYGSRPMDTAREAAVTYLSIGAPLNKHLVLETGSMGKPMTALQTCIDELVTHWGVDVQRHAGITRQATPLTSPGKWLNSADYPVALLTQGQSGIVNFRLSIDEKGMPTACHIQKTLRERGFDDAVCKALMKKAKFTPALDASSIPINSYYINTVRFLIPY